MQDKTNATTTLTLTVDRVRFTQENCSIFSAHEDDSLIPGALTIKFFTGPVRQGQRWVVCGAWKDDEKFGMQFVGQFAALATPRTFDELAAFLTSGLIEGWGWSDVMKLRDTFGLDACKVITSESHRLQTEASISDYQHESLMEAWERGQGLAPIYAALTDWGIGAALADRLIKRYKFHTAEIIEENCYAPIQEVSYYTWRVAEQVRAYLGIADDDARRIEAGVAEVIRTKAIEDGNTWLTYDAAIVGAEMLLGLDGDRVEEILAAVEVAMEDAEESAMLVRFEDQMYPGALWFAEHFIAAQIAERLGRAPLIKPEQLETLEAPAHLSAEQWSAVRMALSTPLSILSGGPGCGKSTALTTLIEAATQLRLNVTLMAPTGKAAQRMTEITGYPASTIHRRLKLVPGQTRVSPKTELVTGLVVVDECFAPGTLIDTPYGTRPIENIRPGDRVLSAAGFDTVTHVNRKEVQHVVRVTAGTRVITCSANHPFLTTTGWVNAGQLDRGARLVERTKAMRLVRRDASTEEPHAAFLQLLLLSEMAKQLTGTSGSVALTGSAGTTRQGQERVAAFRHAGSGSTTATYSRALPINGSSGSSEDKQAAPGQAISNRAGRQWAWPYHTASGVACRAWRWVARGICNRAGWQNTGLSDVLQSRHGQPNAQGSDRGRWLHTPARHRESAGSEERRDAGYARVDRVEILQQRDSRLDSMRAPDGRLYFYDLSVAQHPSYAVEGILVHNCSMLDTITASAVLSGIAPSAHILLVGDPDQLPSVGPGAVLRDILATDVVPHVHLTKVFRNEAGIARAAANIRAGKEIESADDCQILEAADPDDAQDQVIGLIQRELPAHGYESSDVIVLCPTNDGASGRHILNTRLQELFNGRRRGTGIARKLSGKDESILFELRQDDRIIVTKNNTDLQVFNGDTGVIIKIASPKTLVARINDRDVTFSGADLNMVQLAYAITIHKAQGSEAPVVIVPMFKSRILDRALLYTGLTRARKQVYLVGDPNAIQGCIRVVRINERRTGLVEAIAIAVCGVRVRVKADRNRRGELAVAG